jgi:hypothetical protein
LEGVRRTEKEPELWMIKAGFVGSKETTAEASKQAKSAAKCHERIAASKPKWTTGKGLFEQREQIAPRKLKQRELDQREQQHLRMEISLKVLIVNNR